ncbi:hypothetical protein AQUCO_00201100v1 [Aquilegia coerulea]|uniref:Uncharacterized protein n=1 Tax=Aquilegia coerulea TaxID=218851 RepID=A0A2G5F6B5_AQUCA|nr:hypothetical protein AQUCO_00201100v1 [Aquilegia coerulea]
MRVLGVKHKHSFLLQMQGQACHLFSQVYQLELLVQNCSKEANATFSSDPIATIESSFSIYTQKTRLVIAYKMLIRVIHVRPGASYFLFMPAEKHDYTSSYDVKPASLLSKDSS